MSAWVEGTFDLIVSEPLPEKIERELQYLRVRKLLRRAGVPDDDVRDYLDILRTKALNASADNTVLSISPPDPKDIPVLEAFVCPGADFLVTGDKKHLLSLGMRQIVTARDFARHLKAFEAIVPGR